MHVLDVARMSDLQHCGAFPLFTHKMVLGLTKRCKLSHMCNMIPGYTACSIEAGWPMLFAKYTLIHPVEWGYSTRKEVLHPNCLPRS